MYCPRLVGASGAAVRAFLDMFAACGALARPHAAHVRTFGAAVVEPVRLRKLLVANRGEIACRIISTARRLGIPTVAVFSEADRHALHVRMADEAFCLGPAAARDSYLRGDVILGAAAQLGVDAIHPGYGFLSENASFADACEARGVTFVGPPASAIRSMGSKSEAKAIMAASGVPVVPGYHGDDQSDEALLAAAGQAGFPLLVKAVSGGGGKGMKLAPAPEQLLDAIHSARREAASSFGDERVLLERYIERSRHVEVQIMADGTGNAVFVFDRDCSVQRRHQKIIEEAPAPGLSHEFHEHLGQAAVRAAQAVGYRGAGTVEFIVDCDTGEFFFMEMNTRLQVEHPVTEAVAGVDLVEAQLRVAAGQPLPWGQEQLVCRGHAFEARIYAESPARGFLPGGGTVRRWLVPEGASSFARARVRVDCGVRAGDVVGTHYDPMIAKLVVHGTDREDAREALVEALAQVQVAGLPTNLSFLRRLAAHRAFAALELDTGFISRYADDLLAEPEPSAEVVALAAVARHLLEVSAVRAAHPPQCGMGAWEAGDGKRLWHQLSRSVAMRVHGAEQPLSAALTQAAHDRFQVRVAGAVEPVLVERAALTHDTAAPTASGANSTGNRTISSSSSSASGGSATMCAQLGGRVVRADLASFATAAEHVLCVWVDGGAYEFRWDVPRWSKASEAPAAAGAVLSPMPGRVVKVLVSQGARVARGAALVVLEAMKMEHAVVAPCDGVVAALAVRVGVQVDDGAVLCEVLTSAAAEAAPAA